MRSASKKNTNNLVKPSPSQNKNLKRSKSTDQLGVKKGAKRGRDASEEATRSQTLIKCKSTKSLKPKAKSSGKSSQHTVKKGRSKKTLEGTTVKRGIHELSSILSEEYDPKKTQRQYFVYHNNYIPIENSAQRRLVFKIQMIDLEQKENKSTTESFLPHTTAVTEAGVVAAVETSNGATQTHSTSSAVAIVQTQQVRFAENAEKCFVDVLTELEFLYMPNDNNFKPFTPNQRIHYGELLEALSKKMMSGNKGAVEVQQNLNEEQISLLVYQREGIQVGALEYVPNEGFPTHLLSILAYLKNLFCYIEYAYKNVIIDNLRAFYGLNYNQRLSRLARGLPHVTDAALVLPWSLFEQFEHQMFKDYDFNSEVAEKSVHAHNRALFDAVNMELQTFRPFFTSEGEPFPWSNNLGMTHYDITEEALYIIFMQVREKIQKCTMSLCGMHLDFDDSSIPSANKSPYYQKKMDQRERRVLCQQIKQFDDKVAIDYELASLKVNLANEVLLELVREVEEELGLGGGTDREDYEDDFQFFN